MPTNLHGNSTALSIPNTYEYSVPETEGDSESDEGTYEKV